MVSSDESRDSDHPAPRHSPLLSLKKVYSSRRDAALKPVDLQGQPMEVREPPRAVRQQPVHLREEPVRLREERARLRGEPWRWQEQGQLRELRATGLRPEQRGLGSGASAAPPPWIAPRSDH